MTDLCLRCPGELELFVAGAPAGLRTRGAGVGLTWGAFGRRDPPGCRFAPVRGLPRSSHPDGSAARTATPPYLYSVRFFDRTPTGVGAGSRAGGRARTAPGAGAGGAEGEWGLGPGADDAEDGWGRRRRRVRFRARGGWRRARARTGAGRGWGLGTVPGRLCGGRPGAGARRGVGAWAFVLRTHSGGGGTSSRKRGGLAIGGPCAGGGRVPAAPARTSEARLRTWSVVRAGPVRGGDRAGLSEARRLSLSVAAVRAGFCGRGVPRGGQAGRVAPAMGIESTGAIFTTEREFGAWMIWPSPRYMPTWLMPE